MTDNLSGEIARLNNTAAQAMADGDFSTAIRTLEGALQRLYRSLPQQPDEPRQDDRRADPMVLRALPIHPRLCLNEHVRSPDNPFRVYKVAFFIDVPQRQEGHLLPRYHRRDELALVILYNAGLAFLGKGLRIGKNALLRRSLQLHTVATAILQSGDDAGAATQKGTKSGWWYRDEHFRLLSLALWTNQGFLHSYYLDFASVLQSKDQVKYLANAWNGDEVATLPSSPEADLSLFREMIFWIEVCGVPQQHLASAA